jgi:DNA-binding GntR family transcriptional regulator
MKLSIIKKTKIAPGKRRTAPAVAKGDTNVGERLDTILRAIEEDIVVGKMRPGERLDERTLAQRFSVSRTPIREVLVRMSSLGIVELKRNQGAFVAEISSGRLIGMLEVMGELKVLAARQSARRMSVEERQRLIGLRDEMAACVKKGTLQEYFDRATALHDAICEGTHNAFLVESTRNIQVCLCAYRRHLSRILHLPIQTSLQENSNIVDAITQGDSAEAERWMREQTELRREEFSDLITLVSEKVTPTESTGTV